MRQASAAMMIERSMREFRVLFELRPDADIRSRTGSDVIAAVGGEEDR